MATMNNARDRAEDLLQNLQRKAREWLEAEEGLVHTVRDLVEERGLSAQDVQRRLDELLGRIRAAKVWERLSQNEKVVALSDYRGEVEKRVDEVTARVVQSLPVAKRAEVDELTKQVKSLNRKVSELARKVKSLEAGQAEA